MPGVIDAMITFVARRLSAFASSAVLVLASPAVQAMTQCPPGSTGAKPVLAWSALGGAFVLAGVGAFVLVRWGFRTTLRGGHIIGLLAGVGFWGAMVYAGLLGFLYFMLTCF